MNRIQLESPTHATGLTGHTPELPTVLHLRTITSVGGGPEKTITNIPRFLSPHGYQGICVYLHPPGDSGVNLLRSRAIEAKAPLVTIEDRGAVDLRTIRELRTLCRRFRPNILHSHDYKTNALALLLRRVQPMHLVTTEHGWVERSPRLRLYYAVDRSLIRLFDHVFCVSEDILRACRKSRVRTQRCSLLHNGITLDDYQSTSMCTRYHSRNSLGLPSDLPLIVAVGRLSPEKGLRYLIKAIGLLARQRTMIRLAIAGHGPEEPVLKREAISHHVQGQIAFLGHVPDTRPVYRAADIFVLSSLREGLPNVVLEAMAMQLPIVATNVGGVSRLIVERQTGLLIPPASPEAIANAIQQFLSNRELAEQCARNARAKVETEFSFAKRIEKIVAVYDRLLGR